MIRILGFLANGFGGLKLGNPFGGIAWARLLIAIEMLAVLVVAVALTIAPQVTLELVAGAAVWAREFAMAARPVVALVGLILVGMTAIGLRAILSSVRLANSDAHPIGIRSGDTSTVRDAA